MDHVAIMKKSWKLIPKILDGRKKIESRWGINKCAPWEKVKINDTVYFKNAGEPITVKSTVTRVKQFNNLNLSRVRKILKKYGGDDGIAISDLNKAIKWARKKRYCSLIYLIDPKRVKPFNINKKGFGIAAAWLTVKNIKQIEI